MKKTILFALVFVLLSAAAFAKEKQIIRHGQYVFEDGKIIMLTSMLQRYDHPLSPRIQPLANIGLASCTLTAIFQNAAGKWQVNYRVESEKSSYDVVFQLAAGDEWQLYTVSPQNSYQGSTPLVLNVVSISNTGIEVELK